MVDSLMMFFLLGGSLSPYSANNLKTFYSVKTVSFSIGRPNVHFGVEGGSLGMRKCSRRLLHLISDNPSCLQWLLNRHEQTMHYGALDISLAIRPALPLSLA